MVSKKLNIVRSEYSLKLILCYKSDLFDDHLHISKKILTGAWNSSFSTFISQNTRATIHDNTFSITQNLKKKKNWFWYNSNAFAQTMIHPIWGDYKSMWILIHVSWNDNSSENQLMRKFLDLQKPRLKGLKHIVSCWWN